MKKTLGFLSVLALLVGTQAHALKKAAAKTSTPAPVASESSDIERRHILSPSIGFMAPGANTMTDNIGGTDTKGSMELSGVIGVAFEYEYMLKEDFSVGGIMRYYQSTGTIEGTRWTESTFVVGGMAHAYLINTNTWLGYVASGLTIINLKKRPSGAPGFTPDPALGLPISLGVAYKFNDKLALGLEHTQIMAWSRDINGWPVSDFMIRLRIAL